jgi:hypothetical protein
MSDTMGNTEPSSDGNILEGVTTRSSLKQFITKCYDDNDRSHWATDVKSAVVPQQEWNQNIKQLYLLYVKCSTQGNSYHITQRLLDELDLDFTEVKFRWWLKEMGIPMVGQEASFTSKARAQKIAKSISYLRQETDAYAASGKKISETKLNWSDETKAAIYQNLERSEKISTKRKKFLAENPEFKDAMVKRFMNAPKHRRDPNRPEKNVISLQLLGVEFTGTGGYFVTLTLNDGSLWHKNPDFICKEFPSQRRVRAVLEIMDFEHWHTQEEALLVVQLYAKLGIHCLILDAVKCYDSSNLQPVKDEIGSFLSVHDIVWSNAKALESSRDVSTNTTK